jgi:hypothetical protein
MIAFLTIAWLLLGQGQSGCGQAAAATGAAELCVADQQARFGESQPKPQQRRQFEEAAEHARRAASQATMADVKSAAAELLARLYDEQHLNQPDQEQSALLDVITLRPLDLGPIDRLARVLERIGLPEAAEDTLLAVHRRQPNDVEPQRLLAQFYARRVTALHRPAETRKPETSALVPAAGRTRRLQNRGSNHAAKARRPGDLPAGGTRRRHSRRRDRRNSRR